MRWLALSVALAGAAACDRPQVTHVRVPKAPAPSAPPTAPASMTGDVPPPPRPSGPVLAWTLPKGWTEGDRGGPMRYASFRVPAKQGDLEATVTMLSGSAGGELANVNRWRNQLRLGPIDEGALASARKTVRSKAGPLNVYDFTSGDERLIAGLTDVSGNTWFVKLKGKAADVGAARDDFMKLLGSLRLDESH